MSQPVAERAGEVGAVPEGVHLVDAHALEAIGGRLDRVQQADRLAVGERQDDVGTGSDVVENGLGRGLSGRLHDRRTYARRRMVADR